MTPSHPHQRIRFAAAVAAILFAAAALSAQAPAPRIQAEIDSSQLVAIPGSANALARVATDLGRMPADTPLHSVTMRFNQSAAQQAAINALIAAQQDPASPQYHQWLTPDQYAARFGMAQSDIDKVTAWLQQQGFTVDGVNRSHTAIHFSGTVSQIESAFSTQMHYFQIDGEKHFAPSTALSVPAAIAPVVADIHNLDNFRPRAAHIIPRKNFTSGVSGSVFFAPGDIVTTYDIQPLYAAGIHGNGQTIAIMGQSGIALSDIEAFQSAAGLSVKDPNIVLVPGSGDSALYSGDESESDLDLEWSGAIAPGANIVFVYTGNGGTYGTFDSAAYAIDEGIGNIISMSYTICELDPTVNASYITSQEDLYKQAALQGQTVVSASGDQGSSACYGDSNLPATGATSQETVSVNYPASSAYVTGIGGTEISAADGIDPSTGAEGANFSTYWNSDYNSANPSPSNDLISSAKVWIPEVAWNDDSLNASFGGCTASQPCLSASGGGASTLVTRPAWQAGVPGIPSGSMRLVPDISFYASPALPGYLYCTSDQSAWGQTQTGSCGAGFRASSTDDSVTLAGGTSFGTPIFAGMLALLNQNGNYSTGAGLVNPTLYTLAAVGATYSSDFHDVTSGNNDCEVPANCSGTAGFSAGTGYDEVTGLGSIDVAKLAHDWPAAGASEAALIGTSVSVQPANTAPNVNQADLFTITVSSDTGSTTPGGTVTLQIDGGANCGGLSPTPNCGGSTITGQTLNAQGQVTYNATFTTGGVHSIVAQYSGDATHAASTGVGSVTIQVNSSGKGTIAAAATPSTLTVAQGNSGTETITITPSGGYTGTVLLSLDFGSGDNALNNLCGGFNNPNNPSQGEVQITGTQAGSATLQLDTNASDCATSDVAKRHGVVQLRTLFKNGGMAKNTPPAPRRSPLPPAMALAGLVLVGFLGRRSRSLRNLVAVLALAAAGLMISACGSSSTSTTVPDPPKGTYTGTITATDSTTSTITATTTFTFVIN